jgi:DNA-binding XRE family transcriptional regulator
MSTHFQSDSLPENWQLMGVSFLPQPLEAEYALVHQMLAARSRAGLTQEAVAAHMGTTKSAVSRLEAAGKHSPSIASLQKYAEAVGCALKIEFVSQSPVIALNKYVRT